MNQIYIIEVPSSAPSVPTIPTGFLIDTSALSNITTILSAIVIVYAFIFKAGKETSSLKSSIDNLNLSVKNLNERIEEMNKEHFNLMTWAIQNGYDAAKK